MKKYLLLTTLIALFTAGGAGASDSTFFMFGVWSGIPHGAPMGQHLTMLHDTLHMNTVLEDCVTNEDLEQYSNPLRPLKVIVSNQWYSATGMNAYLRLYTLAPYVFFESEGTEFADTHLRYIGGRDTTIGGVNCRYFQALTNPPDSLMLIQTGPGLEGYNTYNQLGWYAPQFMDTTYERAHLQYKAFLRFKLGPRTGPVSSQPLAAFYAGHYGGIDEILYPNADTLFFRHTPVYLYDSQFDSAGTDFIWTDTLKYQWNNTIDDSAKYQKIGDVMFNVKWSGKRDIYIDKVKLMDNYGKWLWEDTVVSFRNISDFVTRFYDTSSTVLGWYLQDDQDKRTNCDNVFSARRVDSLLTNRFSHKPGFVVPGGWAWDYISMASYSNVSFFSYHIDSSTRTDSDSPYVNSVQQAWDGLKSDLANMSDLARSKGVKPYATLQAFALWGARRPTPEENLCQVNLALAYGMKGILYWRYGAYNGWEDSTGRTPFWYSVKETVGPYIDKMGPIFASLEWKYAWKWGEEPPSGAIIDSIRCVQYGDSGQDPLYLQVAEFEPASLPDDTAYFFLVNRRCLPEESITGMLSFVGFAGISREIMVYSVTDMLTDTTWICDDHQPPADPYSFNYAVPPGAGRLYRVVAHQPCKHGDANTDGSIDISDVVFLIARIFSGGAAPNPPAAGDANCDKAVDISDVVFLIAYIFSGGSAPCGACE